MLALGAPAAMATLAGRFVGTQSYQLCNPLLQGRTWWLDRDWRDWSFQDRHVNYFCRGSGHRGLPIPEELTHLSLTLCCVGAQLRETAGSSLSRFCKFSSSSCMTASYFVSSRSFFLGHFRHPGRLKVSGAVQQQNLLFQAKTISD
jgi:hypothetical protein